MTDEEAAIWKAGFEAGSKSTFKRNEDALEIGDAILKVMYRRFAEVEEDF